MSRLRELCAYVGSTITADFVANTMGIPRGRAATLLSNLRHSGFLEVEGTVRLPERGFGKRVMYRYRVREVR